MIAVRRLIVLVFLLHRMTGGTDVSAQTLDKAVQLWNNEQIDELEKLLPDLARNHAKEPESIFLMSVFNADAEKATETFEMLLTKHPDHRFADACLARLIQYDYARAAYETARQRATVLRNEFPKSPYVARIDALFAGFSSDAGTVTVQTAGSATGRYRLQVGAFGQRKNAEELRDKLQNAGYKVEFSEKTVNQQALILVWVGPYASREDAANDGAVLKGKFQLNFTIVEK